MIQSVFNFYKSAIIGEWCGKGICENYRAEWKKIADDKKKLVAFSLRQQSIPYFATACHKKVGLTRQQILSEFGKYINGYTIHNADKVKGYTYGLYVDFNPNDDLIVDKDVVHIMWTVGATMVVPQTKCPTIYISNKSNVHLVCEGYNSPTVYLFDNSHVTIEDFDQDCSILIYKYSDNCSVDFGKFCLSNRIKIHTKELRL